MKRPHVRNIKGGKYRLPGPKRKVKILEIYKKPFVEPMHAFKQMASDKIKRADYVIDFARLRMRLHSSI